MSEPSEIFYTLRCCKYSNMSYFEVLLLAKQTKYFNFSKIGMQRACENFTGFTSAYADILIEIRYLAWLENEATGCLPKN